jgi:hypothetical protein
MTDLSESVKGLWWSHPPKGDDAHGLVDCQLANGSLSAIRYNEDRSPIYGEPVPADAALRLLAAEASDRLGWQWRLREYKGVRTAEADRLGDCCWSAETSGIVFVTSPDQFTFTPDELLACLHGRYLLDAAMKERAT